MNQKIGRNNQGRFIKKNDPMAGILKIQEFNLLEICDKPITFHDNPNANIIHKKLHSDEELEEGIRPCKEMNTSFPNEDRPVIRPLDFTDEWRRQKKRQASRHHRLDDEEDLDLDLQALVNGAGSATPAESDPSQTVDASESPKVSPPSPPPTPVEGPPIPRPVLHTAPPSESIHAPALTLAASHEARQHRDEFVPMTTHTLTAPPQVDEAELEAIREAAYAEGYQQGYSQGEQKGTIEAQHKIEAILTEVGQIIENLQGMQKSILLQAQDNFLTICRSLIEALLDREFQIHPDAFGSIIQRALAEALPEDECKVLVSPQMYAGLKDWAEHHLPGRLKLDDGLQAYQFRIEGRHTVVDAHIQDLIRKLLDQADLNIFEAHQPNKERAG